MDMKIDIRGIMRRVTVGNITGAKKIIENYLNEEDIKTLDLEECEERCIQKTRNGTAVAIQAVIDGIMNTVPAH